METNQTYLQLIDDRTTTLTAAQQQYTVTLKEKLRTKMRGDLIAHLVGLCIEHILTPTFTTAPTVNAITNASLPRIVFKAERGNIRADVTGLDIRAMESYEQGSPISPTTRTTQASTNIFATNRFLSLAPIGFRGGYDSFALPTALLTQGTLDVTVGATTDVSADATTASTLRTRIWGVLIGRHTVRIPPFSDIRYWNASGNGQLFADRALIPSMLLLNASDHSAIANGDFANITLSDTVGEIHSSIPSQALTRAYWSQMKSGVITDITGEPLSATDDNASVKNPGTPTALVAATAAYQPLLWSPEGSGIDQTEAMTPGELRWSGTQSTGFILARRILARGDADVKALALDALEAMKLPFKGMRIKQSANGRPYVGNRPEFQPWDVLYK